MNPNNLYRPDLVGAKLYFFAHDTDVMVNVFADPDLTVPHSQPLHADCNGRFHNVYQDRSVWTDAKMFDSKDRLLFHAKRIDLDLI